MNDSDEDIMAFIGNVLRALLIDLKEHGAGQDRLERIASNIEAENTDIFDPVIRAYANLTTTLALAGALTSREVT